MALRTSPLSRRSFIAASAVGAAHVWVPTGARGYTAAELGAPDGVTGVSKWELDTPALCVDLDALESNIRSMQSRLAARGLAPVPTPRPTRPRPSPAANGRRRARHLHVKLSEAEASSRRAWTASA